MTTVRVVSILLMVCLLVVAKCIAAEQKQATRLTNILPVGARYAVVDLGTLGGASQAHAINSRGQVAGEAETAEPKPGWEVETHAFLWTRGRMHDLGALAESESQVHTSKAFALNARGEAVGGSGDYGPMIPEMGVFVSASPFLYAHGRMRLLDKPVGGRVPFGEARGINGRGEIVGANGGGAFLWRRGRLSQLGTLRKGPSGIIPTERDSSASGINNGGQVVGYAAVDAKGSVTHPFLWRRGRMTDLGTPPGTTDGSADAINSRGDVAGTASGPAQQGVVWWWRRGRMRVLPSLPGGQVSVVNRINDVLQIVGSCDQRAVLWEGGKTHDLNGLIAPGSGWQLTEATGINGRGQIVGYGTHNGKRRAFLLKPFLSRR